MKSQPSPKPTGLRSRPPHPGAPADFSALSAAVLARRERLPKRLLQVASHALDNPGDIAFHTTAEIARAIAVQPSTLVRFAQTFGYSGFSELQSVFRDYVRGRWPDYRARVRKLHHEAETHAPLLAGFAQASIRSIEQLIAALPAERIEQAIGLLAGAETIFLIAARRAHPVAGYFNYLFGRLGIRSILIDNAAGMAAEALAFAGPRDVAVAISFTPYTTTTIEFAAQAKRMQVPVVAITDSTFSPLVPLSTLWLDVVEADHASFRSMAATMTLAVTLAAGTAEARGQNEA